jgi:hypothetical protein
MNAPRHPRLRRALRDARVWRRAAKLGLTVGLLQVAVNQGDHWIRLHITAPLIFKSLLSPLLTFSVALGSAALAHRDPPPPSAHE